MSEPLSIDLVRARKLADQTEAACAAALDIRTSVQRNLIAGAMDSSAPILLQEAGDELGLLTSLVRLWADMAEAADTFGPFSFNPADAPGLERQLATGLSDSVGAKRSDASPFDLASAVFAGDRAVWFQLGVETLNCEAPSPSYYPGGGFLTGPDGRDYPIVVPRMVDGDDIFTADGSVVPDVPSVATLGGLDPGWVMVGSRSGIARFTEAPTTLERIAVGIGGTTGLVGPTIGNEALSGIVTQPYRAPRYGDFSEIQVPTMQAPPDILASPSPVNIVVVDGQPRVLTVDEIATSNRVTQRAARQVGVTPTTGGAQIATLNGIDLAVTLGQGAVTAINADDQNKRAYQVTFEEHPDGRRRARLETYQLVAGDDEVLIQASHVFVDETGDLVEASASYFFPPGDNQAPTNDFTVADPTWVRPVPDNAFSPD